VLVGPAAPAQPASVGNNSRFSQDFTQSCARTRFRSRLFRRRLQGLEPALNLHRELTRLE
jgi:hypothetical protein